MKDEHSERAIPEFVLTDVQTDTATETKPIAFWVPAEAKGKYEKLQAISGTKYGKFLQSIFVESIERTFEKYKHRF